MLACLIVAAAPTFASPDRAVLEDAVEIQLLGRELLALTPSGGPYRLRLEKGEVVHWTGAKGRVGLVVTNRRALGVSPRASGWLEAPRRIQEKPDGQPMLSARLALLLSDKRILAYDADAARWVEVSIGPHERFEGARIAQAVAVVVTSRRGLGLASGTARFSRISLQIGEHLESLSALADVATLRTSRRVLVFRGTSGSWAVEDRLLY